MSACDAFVEHAWKPGTCTNCFLSKGLHSHSDSSAQSVDSELLQQKIRRSSAPDVRRSENGNQIFGRSRSGSALLARTLPDSKNKSWMPLGVRQHKKATIASFSMEELKGQSKVKVGRAKMEDDKELGHELGRTQKLLEKFETGKDIDLEEEWQREMERFMGKISEKSKMAAKSIPRKSALKKEPKKGKVSVQFAPRVIEVIGQDGGLFSFDGSSDDDEVGTEESEAMEELDTSVQDQPSSDSKTDIEMGCQDEVTEDDLEEELNDLVKTVTQIQENGKTSKFSQLRADAFSPVPFIKQKLYNTVPLCRNSPAPRAAVAPLFHQNSDTDLFRNVASNVAPVKPFSIQGEVRKARRMSDSSGSDGMYAEPYRVPTGNTPPKVLPQAHYYHVLDNSHSDDSERENPAQKAHKDVKVELYQVSLKPQPNFTRPYRVVDLDPPAMVKPYTIIDIATNPPNEYPDPSIVRKGSEPYYHELWNAGSSSGSEKSSPSTSGGTGQIHVDSPLPMNGMSLDNDGADADIKTNAGMPPFPKILKEVGSPKSPHKVPILIDPMAYDNLVGYKGLLHKCSPPSQTNNLKEGEENVEGAEIRQPKVSNLHANKKGPNQQEKGEVGSVLSTFKPELGRTSPEGAPKKRAPPPPPITGIIPSAPPKEMVLHDHPSSPNGISHSPSPKTKSRPAAPPTIQEMVSFIPPPQSDGPVQSFLYTGNKGSTSKKQSTISPSKDGSSSPLDLKTMSPTSPTSPTQEPLSKWSPVGEHKSKKSRGFFKKLLNRNKGELSFVDDSNEVAGDDVVLVNQNLFGGVKSSESSDTLDSIASSRKKSGSSSDASSSEPSPGIRRRMQAFQNNGKDVPIQRPVERPKMSPSQRSIATQIYQKPYHSGESSSEKEGTLERPLRQTRPSTKKTAAPPPPRPPRDKTPTRQAMRPPTQGGDATPAKIINPPVDDGRPPRPARPPARPMSPPRRSASTDRLRKSSDSAGEAEYGNTGFARADLETPAKPTRPSLPPALSKPPSPSSKPPPSTPGLRSVLKSPQNKRKQLSPADRNKDSPPRRPVRVVSPTKEKTEAAFFPDSHGPPHSYVNVELGSVPNGSLSDTDAPTSPPHRKPKPKPRPHTPTKDVPDPSLDNSYYTQLTTMNKKTLEAVTEKWKKSWAAPVEELKLIKAEDIVLIEAVPDCGAEHSVIYRAKIKTLPGRDISVKVCTDPQTTALFQKEVHILQSLPPHPNIYSQAKLIQTQLPGPSHQSQQTLQPGGEHSNQSGDLLGSELAVYTQVPTDTLANYVKESKRLHEKDPEIYEKEVSLLLLQLLKGLEHLKNNNISHCDLRQENILLVADSDKECSPQVLISNFSHAKLRSDDSRSSADIERLAPEVVQAIRNVSDLPYGKCDEFAVGILIYELLHMANPFRNSSLIEKGFNVRDLPEIPRRSVYSEGLRTLSHSLLQPKPQNRITSTQAVESLQCLFWGPPPEMLDSMESATYQEHVYKWLEVEQGKMVNTIVAKCVGNSGGLSLTDGMQCEFLCQLNGEKLGKAMMLVKKVDGLK